MWGLVNSQGCSCGSSNSVVVLLSSYTIDNDWHEAVVDTAKLATLSVEGSGAIDIKAYLIKTARASIHLHTESRNCSAV